MFVAFSFLNRNSLLDVICLFKIFVFFLTYLWVLKSIMV